MKTLQKVLITFGLFVPVLVFAQTGTTTTGIKINKDNSISTSTLNCVSIALEKRENTIILGHDTFNTAIKTALTKRLTGLKDAWSQTDRTIRISKRQEAYKIFKTESQTAHTAMKTARNTAWKTYETEAKACGIRGGTGESPSVITIPNTSL